MTRFIEDLRTYLITNNLCTSSDTVEWYDETKTTDLICISQYDSDATIGRYSLQFLCRNGVLPTCLSKLDAIYNHFFDIVYNPTPVYKEINGTKCLFKPLTKPTFLKYENSKHYYVMNIEVLAQK